MPNGFFLSYKRSRTRKEKGSRAERTKCCQTDSGRFSLYFCSIVLAVQVSRRLALFRGTPVRFLRHLRPALSLVPQRTGIGICSSACSFVTKPRPIVGCNFLLLIHIRSLVASSCVGVYSRYLCRRAVSLCVSGPA